MRSFLEDLWSWLHDQARWIATASPAWGTLGVIGIVAGVASFLPGNTDDRVRYCGMTLELLGVFTVVHGLREKRRLFKRPSLFDHLKDWLGRRPRWGAKNQVIIAASAGHLSISGSARTSIWRGTAPDATLEARFAALEANVETLRSEQAELAKQLQAEAQTRNTALEAERRSRDSVVNALRSQLDTFGAGGLPLETAGLVWLILGVVLATASTEIAWAFSKIG